MKHLIIKLLLVAVILPNLTSQKAQATEAAPGDALVRSLKTFELPEQLATPEQNRDHAKSVLEQLRIQTPPGTEGIKHVELPDAPRPVQYNTARVILEALKQAQTLPMGQKILHYDTQVKEVLETSVKNEGERTARMTVNRTFDVVNTILTMTNTPEAHALYAAGLYENGFKLALAQVNSNVSIYRTLKIDAVTNQVLFIGDYGVMFARLMAGYMNHANLTNAHRSVMVIKTLGYLAWDLRLDVRGYPGRSDAVSNLLIKIYNLQKTNVDMKSLLASLENGQEPNLASLRRVSAQVNEIIAEAPQALEDANREMSIVSN